MSAPKSIKFVIISQTTLDPCFFLLKVKFHYKCCIKICHSPDTTTHTQTQGEKKGIRGAKVG